MKITPVRIDTTLGVLETARDDEENLTPDERKVINEAHAVLQEWDDRR